MIVTGWSGNGGIDGIGILQVNALVSFKVLFQCKKYVELVDGEKLAGMLERLELGLMPRQTFELDSLFFDEFKR